MSNTGVFSTGVEVNRSNTLSSTGCISIFHGGEGEPGNASKIFKLM